jgi:hypothetical protein
MPGNKKKAKAVQRPGTKVTDPKHFKYKVHYRVNVMKVMANIRAGTVDEADLDRLQNYLQMTFKMMDVVPLKMLHDLWRDTEIFGHLHADLNMPDDQVVDDTTIVLDAAKQGPKNRQQRRALGLPNPTPDEVFAGRPQDEIDKWVNSEFTRYEQLDDFEQKMVANAATFGSGVVQEVKPDQVLAGNSHNTPELSELIKDLQGVVPDKRGRYITENTEYALLGFIWHGHKVVLCDDLIGVFCSRNTAREIYKTYHERIENESTNP